MALFTSLGAVTHSEIPPASALQPLRTEALSRYAVRNPFWKKVDVVAGTGSTNTDLLQAAATGAPEGSVLVAESQVAGRGRLDRQWAAPPSRGLALSFLLRPNAIPMSSWGWVSLVAGLGVYDALRGCGVDVALKWPNDIQAGDNRLKCGGILTQVAGTTPAVVVGIGLNVLETADELPPEGTSLAQLLPDVQVDRTDVLIGLLDAICLRYSQWYADPASGEIAQAYRQACGTIGLQIAVSLPGRDDVLRGVARDVDGQGRLVVEAADGIHAVSAGDVVHVRPAGPAGN